MLLVEVLTVLLPIMALLSLVALLPVIIFSRLIFERYEKMYDAFLLGLAGMLLLDIAYLASVIGIKSAYKAFEILSMSAFIGAMWVVVKNAASIFIVAEANKRLESEVKAKTAELEIKLREITESRTALVNMLEDLDQTHAELQKAFGELKELDRVKSDILSNVSHELRTPITIAKGAIELAMEDLSEGESREILGKGKGALMKLNKLVGDLITVAGMGREKLTTKEVTIQGIINDVVMELTPLAASNEVTIETEVRGVPVVEGDADEISKMVYHLLDNAIKFNKRGGHVRIAATVGDGNTRVTVEDTGIGIPRGEFDKIFQPLYQVDASTTRKYPGTGIGLAIVDNAVKAHRGSVHVESEVGRGSKFTVLLPLRQAGEKLKEQVGKQS